MIIQSKSRRWWIAALFSACACSGKTVHDVGDVDSASGSANGGANGGADASAASPGTSSNGGAEARAGSPGGSLGAGAAAVPEGPRPDAPPSLVGTWRGYVENYQFSDGSDALELTIAPGALSGTLVAGDAAAPPPATDAEAAYPPGTDARLGSLPLRVGTSMLPGFAFSLLAPALKQQRFQFGIATRELFRSWCELQTSYATEGPYNCLPNWGGGQAEGVCSQTDPQTMQVVMRSCAKLNLCLFSMVCTCTMAACGANLEQTNHFDLVINSDHADGSVDGLDGSVHNVHLVKE